MKKAGQPTGETGSRAGFEEPVRVADRRPRIRAVNDDAVLIELFRPLRRAVLFQIIGRGVSVVAHRHQMALHQIGLARRCHADRDIGLAHRQIELGIVDHDRDLDLGIEIEKFADPRRQPGRAERDRGRDL